MTEQNKKEFEKWCSKRKGYTLVNNKHLAWMNKNELSSLVYWDELPFEMQIGVYLAYYDSLGIIIQVDVFDSEDEYIWSILERDCMSPFFKSAEVDLLQPPKTRNEAFKEAFKKANEIRNKQLNQ